MEKYEKVKIVGRGAYGTVYLCHKYTDKKPVIIKQIPVEQMTKEERQAALNEVKVLSMLDHPNIIEYYENFLEDKALMIVMEYAEGGTLFEYLQKRNGQLLEEEEILRFFAQMLLSLQHVHSKQILHRDLKTQNILLDKKHEVVKVGDFGISKVLSSKSKAYTVVGTPCYISPELCEGKPYNQSSDIWALGCVLYELASLKRAFEAQNLPALILKIMRGIFSPISDHYSDDLRQIILSMLHLDPGKRPNIIQIMAQPIVLNTLMNLYTDFGKVPCRRAPRPLSNLPGPSRRVHRSASGKALNIMLDPTDSLHTKPLCQSCVYCWGCGGVTAPTRLALPTGDTQVTQVAAGRTQKAAITKTGRPFVWEAPAVGVDSLIPGAMDSGAPVFIPRYLEGQSAVTIQQVSCGDLFTACLTDRGILMTFGSGANGCLGHGNYSDVAQAKIVEKLLGFEIVQVSCGGSHVLAVTNENEVFGWGRGENGRLGIGAQESFCIPQEVPIPLDYKPSVVYCGVDCSMLLTLESELLCCGSNRDNKLALDSSSNQLEEVHTFCSIQSQPLMGEPIKTVAMGMRHAAAVTFTGELYTLGSNEYGQLGRDEPSQESRDRQPYLVAALKGHHVSMVGCGDTFTVAATTEGEVFSWGKSARGRLGRPVGESHLPRPLQLDEHDVFEVVSIACSHGTTLLATKPRSRPGSPH